MAVLVKVDEATFSMSARLPDQFETLMICDAAVVEVLDLLMVADVPPSVPFAIFAAKIVTELGDRKIGRASGRERARRHVSLPVGTESIKRKRKRHPQRQSR